MSVRYPQVKNMPTPQALRDRLAELGLDLAVEETVDAAGPLAQPFTITDGSAGPRQVGNRFAILPMEGWDGTTNGAPTDLVQRRWRRFGAGGAKLLWGEATAVVPSGRANPNQLVMSTDSAGPISALRSMAVAEHRERFGRADDLVVGLQLTHSGRWSRPDGSPAPRTAYDHPLLDRRVPTPRPFTDDELDALSAAYVEAAVLAAQAGFDFVDVKHCHGYLLHELLSGHDRPGRYGGSFEDRTRFLSQTVAAIRARAPRLMIAVRLSAYDMSPFGPGDDRVGVPDATGDYRYAFGGDGTGEGIDLAEPHRFLELCESLGIGLVSVTAGSPYYNPHVQRPAFFPPSDGYLPPEDPLVGVVRMAQATADLQRAHPGVAIVNGGMSYLQDWLAHVGQRLVADGATTVVGLGRMALSYPDLPADVAAGRPFDRRLVCRTFSDCTTAPRNGMISGCFPLDDFYKDRPERVELAKVKRGLRAR